MTPSSAEEMPDAESAAAFAALLDRVTITTPDGRRLLGPVSLAIRKGEHWAVLGANGAGKTTLLRLLGAERHPSSGTAVVLGARLGACDLRQVRSCIGVVSHAVADRLPPSAAALGIVLTAGAESWRRGGYRATRQIGCAACRSSQRSDVRDSQIVRSALVPRASASGSCSPFAVRRASAVVAGRACAGMDLPGREALVLALTALARSPKFSDDGAREPQPRGAARHDIHALLLRAGEVVAIARSRRS